MTAKLYKFGGSSTGPPEGVVIVGWMPVPDTGHLPIAEHYAGFSVASKPSNLLGSIETEVPSIFECIFEGDYSEIKRLE